MVKCIGKMHGAQIECLASVIGDRRDLHRLNGIKIRKSGVQIPFQYVLLFYTIK